MNRENKIEHKWGFGHSPLKKETICKNRKAVLALYENMKNSNVKIELEEISLFKGLISRCIKKDQWDWFTIYTLFGRPDIDDLKPIVTFLIEYRRALKEHELEKISFFKNKLIKSNILNLCEIYLGKRGFAESGYIYILSRREEPEILKIGMTTRDVEIRLKEINSATGMLYPYSIRHLFKVEKPAEAEKLIFDELTNYRIRKDREFFKIEYKEALTIIESCLKR